MDCLLNECWKVDTTTDVCSVDRKELAVAAGEERRSVDKLSVHYIGSQLFIPQTYILRPVQYFNWVQVLWQIAPQLKKTSLV